MIILDTSVAVKLLFHEEGSDQAHELFRKEAIGAPALLLYEISNVIVNQKLVRDNEIELFFEKFFSFGIQYFVLPEHKYAQLASLARKHGLSAYDATFVVLAESMHLDFVTADRKLYLKTKSLPHVHLLQN